MTLLTEIKKQLCVGNDTTAFDDEIQSYISPILLTLNELGALSDEEMTLLLQDPNLDINTIFKDDIRAVAITYIGMKVKLIFDPPSTSFVLEAFNRQLEELEWRMRQKIEFKTTEEEQ